MKQVFVLQDTFIIKLCVLKEINLLVLRILEDIPQNKITFSCIYVYHIGTNFDPSLWKYCNKWICIICPSHTSFSTPRLADFYAQFHHLYTGVQCARGCKPVPAIISCRFAFCAVVPLCWRCTKKKRCQRVTAEVLTLNNILM